MNQIIIGRQYVEPLTGERVLIKAINKNKVDICSWDHLKGVWVQSNPESLYALKHFWEPYWIN